MRVFIAGATGVIGRRLVPRLLGAGHEVTAVARSPQKRSELMRAGATPVDLDLFAPHLLPAAVHGHDAVINRATHMPSSSARMLLPGAWRENDRLRSEAAPNLATAALQVGVPRLIQESFAPIYPDCGETPIDEGIEIEPAKYNRSVEAAEAAAERFAGRGGAGVVLRFAAFYGPDSRFTLDLIELVRHGFAPLLGPEGAFISSISHDDAANAVVRALELPSGVYNVADDEPVTHRTYVDRLSAALFVDPPRLPPAWFAPLMGSMGRTMARSQRISNAKLRAAGWAPKYRSVREGFAALAEELGVTRVAEERVRATAR